MADHRDLVIEELTQKIADLEDQLQDAATIREMLGLAIEQYGIAHTQRHKLAIRVTELLKARAAEVREKA